MTPDPQVRYGRSKGDKKTFLPPSAIEPRFLGFRSRSLVTTVTERSDCYLTVHAATLLLQDYTAGIFWTAYES